MAAGTAFLIIAAYYVLVLIAAWLLRPYRAPGYFRRCVKKMFSARLIFSVGCLGVLILVGVGILLSAIGWGGEGSEWLIYPTVTLMFVAWGGVVLSDAAVLYCPHCGSRVRGSEGVCRKCGRDLHST